MGIDDARATSPSGRQHGQAEPPPHHLANHSSPKQEDQDEVLASKNGPDTSSMASSRPDNELSERSQSGATHGESDQDPSSKKDSFKGESPKGTRSAPRPQLQSSATTAVSRTDIHTQSYQDGTRETFATSPETPPSGKSPRFLGRVERFKGLSGSEAGDTASIRSFVPPSESGGDSESLIGDVLGIGEAGRLWSLLGDSGNRSHFEYDETEAAEDGYDGFHQEFEDTLILDEDEDREQQLLAQWKSKRKHFLILSSAGKPIYSRHGDDNVISSIMGTIQTIISFFEGSENQLRSFTTTGSHFVIMSQGPLYLVAISKLGESEAQLRAQLDALYMQILSTLTLPTLTTLFANRPSTDLRRPLKGTEVLLSALADTFTRGSPTALLSALECLKMRKSQRKIIDDTLLRTRSAELLYGLVVAGGRLVSVVRPRKHSLHAGDLQLIFNMLFEADGVKAGGGENWIPLCLPGFNKNGYLYMYVSFVPVSEGDESDRSVFEDRTITSHDAIAILLISSNKESFFELRKMRDDIVAELEKNEGMASIRNAVNAGRPSTTDIVPGTVIYHFLYKSRANVQYFMPSYEPHYADTLSRRKLLSLYQKLHASVHARNAHLTVQHSVNRGSISIAWMTPLFELYCVAGSHPSRSALAQGANKIVQWIRREEERVFIIGGGVF